MNHEENRLRTFYNWPSTAPVSAERIARAGFYYTGVGLEVQCFLCGRRIIEWSYGDQVVILHRIIAPHCPFVLNPSNTCNVPRVPAAFNYSSESNAGPQLNAEPQLNGGPQLNGVPHLNVEPQINSRPRSQSKTDQRISVNGEEFERNFVTYNQRLVTFATWPIPNIVLPENLARAGFIYSNEADSVICVFCRGIVYQWESGSDPITEHRIHFPSCDFYLRSDIGTNQLSHINIFYGSTIDSENLGVNTLTSIRTPCQSSFETRLRSYANWPTDHPLTPEMLADAGFYYSGYQDHVRCYCCDGGLFQWTNMDNPWVEHAKWFPTCDLIKLVKGQEFIDQCVSMRPSADEIVSQASNPENNVESNVQQIINNPYGYIGNPIVGNTVYIPVINLNINITEQVEGNYIDITEQIVDNTVNTTEVIENNTVNITEVIEDNAVNTTEETEENYTTDTPRGIESSSATEESSSTYSSSTTEESSVVEIISGTESSSTIEERFIIEINSTTDSSSTSGESSIIEMISTIEPNLENEIDELTEGQVDRTTPDQVDRTTPDQVDRTTPDQDDRTTPDQIDRTTPDQETAAVSLPEGAKKRIGYGINMPRLFKNYIPECITENPNWMELIPNFSNLLQIRSSSENETNERSNNDTENSNTSSTINKVNEIKEENPNSSQATETSDSNDKPVEKITDSDLAASLCSLEEENKNLKEARTCKVCMDKEIAVVFLPCGHLATCIDCAPSFASCPICRKNIYSTVRTYFP